MYTQSHLNSDHERVTYAARGLRVDISGRPRVTVLQLLNVTFLHLTSKAQTVVHN